MRLAKGIVLMLFNIVWHCWASSRTIQEPRILAYLAHVGRRKAKYWTSSLSGRPSFPTLEVTTMKVVELFGRWRTALSVFTRSMALIERGSHGRQ